jgi:hypothetical protein
MLICCLRKPSGSSATEMAIEFYEVTVVLDIRFGISGLITKRRKFEFEPFEMLVLVYLIPSKSNRNFEKHCCN